MTDMPITPSHTERADSAVQTGASFPVWAVYKRETLLYFRSPIAYAIAFAMLLFLSILFNDYITSANGQAPADGAYGPGLISFLMFLIAPLLTMRLLAEENREGTLEVLMTMPMNESAFIIGKFLAAWTYYTFLLLLTLVYYIIFAWIGVPDAGASLGAYIGAWLYGGATIAVALIWSAVTEDQIVAAFLGAATILMLYLAENAASSLSGAAATVWLSNVVRELGLQAHFNATMLRGIIRLEDVLYFIFVIAGALFITTRIVETRRWRG